MKHNIIQIFIAVVLVFSLLALADLLPFWMPDMNEMIVLLFATLLILAWAGFVMYERPVDEREVFLRMNAGHIAYLSGIGVLTLALLVQGVRHDIDPWVLAALGVMVLAKLCTRLYAERE